MIENIIIFVVIGIALYYVIKTFKKALSEKSQGCLSCCFDKNKLKCNGLCGKIKRKD
ncbi:MAG: hypothetical protein AB7U85_04560 [Alphaproteobacteria bacterium]